MFYSKATGWFYSAEIHGGNIPADAVEISEERHAALLAGQAEGKLITADSAGAPVLTDRPGPSAADTIKAQIAAIEATITPRRMREALLGADGGWLAAQDATIAELRASL